MGAWRALAFAAGVPHAGLPGLVLRVCGLRCVCCGDDPEGAAEPAGAGDAAAEGGRPQVDGVPGPGVPSMESFAETSFEEVVDGCALGNGVAAGRARA